MKLTDAKLRTLSEPGKHFDGGGLFLHVKGPGRCLWRLKYRFGGKEKLLALGAYPTISLKEARERADEARKALSAGNDPGSLRKAAKLQASFQAVNTLEAVANDWMTHQAAKWGSVTEVRVRSSLASDVFPVLGSRSLCSIRPGEVMAVVKTIESRGAGDQAGRVLQRIKAVYRWAVIHERLDSNPMLDLVPSEILKPRQVNHRAALSDRELPTFLSKLDAYGGDPHTVNALRLLVLTAVRPGEVRGARWDEFDMEAALWIIPAERMKMGQEHRVPLSRQALDILKAMVPLSGEKTLVFPSPFYPSKPLSENTFNSALARMGFKCIATAHGFRALFSTVANEVGWNGDVVERQLAHKEPNSVRAAYNRSTHFQERQRLMQWWADYVDNKRIGGRRKILEAP
jgi:integrase